MPTVTVQQDEFTPAMYNNPELTKRLVAVWKKTLGDQNVEMVDPTMGGEDFSEYSLLRNIRFLRSIFMSARSIRRKWRIKKARRAAIPNPAFQQVRTRAGTNDSHWDGGDDGGGAGLDEEIIFEKRERRVAVSDRAAQPLFNTGLQPVLMGDDGIGIRHPERQSRGPFS